MGEIASRNVNCKTCGAVFLDSSTRRHRVYCGTKCYPGNKPKWPAAVVKRCAHCGKQFSDESRSKRGKYCSDKCKKAHRREDPIDREKRLARSRDRYHKEGWKEYLRVYNRRPEVIERRRRQVRLYRARHPEKVAELDKTYRNRRNKRIAEQSDGTAGAMVAKLLKLRQCQYCGHRFNSDTDKRIDHREPVAFGGQHSAANLELCCDACNSRKAAMPFAEWVDLLAEPHRSKAIARAEKARGAPIHQHPLPLFGGAVIRRPREKAVNAYEAKRDALAAWRKWLYEMAPNDWLDGYYANHPKPWTDHRLTQSQSFLVQYKADPAFARRWNDARNARRRRKRAEARMSKINSRFFLESNGRVASRAESN